MDTIFLTDLRAEAIIGINDWEREVRQTVSVDLEMATDITAAAATDSIDHAINYKTIAHRLVDYIESSNFGLIETLTENIASILMNEFSIPWVRVTFHKLGAISKAKDVGVIIERGTKPAQ